jgi:hypothetical protein
MVSESQSGALIVLLSVPWCEVELSVLPNYLCVVLRLYAMTSGRPRFYFVSLVQACEDEVRRLRFTSAATTGFKEPILQCRLNKPSSLSPPNAIPQLTVLMRISSDIAFCE